MKRCQWSPEFLVQQAPTAKISLSRNNIYMAPMNCGQSLEKFSMRILPWTDFLAQVPVRRSGSLGRNKSPPCNNYNSITAQTFLDPNLRLGAKKISPSEFSDVLARCNRPSTTTSISYAADKLSFSAAAMKSNGSAQPSDQPKCMLHYYIRKFKFQI